MKVEEITQEDFQAYEEVRQSGVTNMMSSDVQYLAGISKEVHRLIMENYTDLCKKWPAIRDRGARDAQDTL